MVKFQMPFASALAVLVLATSSSGFAQTVAPQHVSRVTLNFKPPEGWLAMSSAIGRISVIRDRQYLHMVWTQTAPKHDLDAYATEQMESARKKGADVSDDGVTTACEGTIPAHRWTIRSLNNATPTVGHYLAASVTGGIGVASYSHPQAVGDRQDAIAALASVCPGPHDLVIPNGWPVPPRGMAPYGMSLVSPDATSTFIGMNRRIAPSAYASFEKANLVIGTVTADRTESCASGTVRHLDVRNGGQLSEITIGYTEGYAYRFIYTRPADHDPDANAETALNAFCRPDPIAPVTSASI